MLTLRAPRSLPAHAVEALAAGCVERHYDLSFSDQHRSHLFPPTLTLLLLLLLYNHSLMIKTYLIPNLKPAHPLPLLHNLAHKLMPADEIWRALEVAAVEVQVAAAQGCRGDFEDGVGRVAE